MSSPIVTQTQTDVDAKELGSDSNFAIVSQAEDKEKDEIVMNGNHSDGNVADCNEDEEQFSTLMQNCDKTQDNNQSFLKWNKRAASKKQVRVKTYYRSKKKQNQKKEKKINYIYDTRNLTGDKKELYKAVNSGNIEDMLLLLRGNSPQK